jgi:hypothetical protein
MVPSLCTCPSDATQRLPHHDSRSCHIGDYLHLLLMVHYLTAFVNVRWLLISLASLPPLKRPHNAGGGSQCATCKGLSMTVVMRRRSREWLVVPGTCCPSKEQHSSPICACHLLQMPYRYSMPGSATQSLLHQNLLPDTPEAMLVACSL